ncbi:MAG: TIGR02680 family protein [Pseudonocardia sp.]|nr:TIGR02680 family protein [Pseudonocardia sp.]
MTDRFRLSRAGVLNVWQYDDQVFEFADGRLLLRGANGAGKSKTLEMLLPFVLDGDKQRMTASARHHTSLLWLMLDGYGKQNRAGYLWVEFARPGEVVTCGVGIRASQSARTATSWYFTVPGRVGEDLMLEDDAGPLARERLRAAVEAAGGQFFDSPRAYKQHVGRLLFGLAPSQYDELLRLLYWLRQPQVGEDIEPARLAEQLVQALPQLDDDAVRAAGDTFDELAAFGEQLDRQRRSAEGVAALATGYGHYAREVLRGRGAEAVEQHRERSRRARDAERCTADVAGLATERAAAEAEQGTVAAQRRECEARLVELRGDPAWKDARELRARQEMARERAAAAEAARKAAGVARRRAEVSQERVRRDAGGLETMVSAHVGRVGELATELAGAGARVALPVPAALHDVHLLAADAAQAAAEGLTAQADATRDARPVLGGLLAAVAIVDTARAALDGAVATRERTEQDAAVAERRAEEERGRLADARRAATAAGDEYAAALGSWRADPQAVPFDPPDELTAETVGTVAALARTAATGPLDTRRAEEAAAGAERRAAEREHGETVRRREEVAAERDPAPPAPPWRRGERDPVDGAPLWRLVDFADALDARARAGLESALEASGLLDAWVRVDGAVLDADGCDVVLPVGPPTPVDARLDAVLRPDPPDGGPVAAAVVRSVLARVALAGHDEVGADEVRADLPGVVGTDGSWRLGPLTGRSTKPVAQYVGATARAAERERRIAELDARIDVLAATRDAAREAETAAREARAAIEAWLTGAPSTSALLTAWTRLDERERVTAQADRRAVEAEEVAVQARGVEAGRRHDLAELAAAHDLPTDAVGLAARRERLRSLDDALSRHADAAAPLRAGLLRWADDAERASAELDEAQEAAGTATVAQERADTARAAADELEATVGASLREIQLRIATAEQRAGDLERRERELTGRVAALLTATGAAEEGARNAALRLAEQEPALAAAVAALAAVDTVPGLLPSGLGEPSSGEAGPTTVDHAATFDLARGFSTGSPVPASVLALARSLAELPPPPRPGTEAALFAAWQDAVSGPAGDREPRVIEIGGALAVVGRDDTGEHPIGTLATRLAAAVIRDAELLTERERRLFEEHVLGDLGESLRARRQEAEELVAEMNQLLRGVTTSQGIAVQLRWTLRDDVAADARRAVELLGQPSGALLPGERRELRDALHRLIEASRADAPEDSYSEHLTRALDYRRWFAFRIRYTRPETPGTWHDLHRRSPLSQGEQKVVCYLPLFAAAAAHFGSLAGAAPHSPRFVLLDDAFPKIDVRTHPLLFGLLVDLDLDFVITSERLWGDHATVPSLAIYEALRDPNERGIAQYRHHWDGQRLQVVDG